MPNNKVNKRYKENSKLKLKNIAEKDLNKQRNMPF